MKAYRIRSATVRAPIGPQKKSTTSHNLAKYMTSLTKLQRGSQVTGTRRNIDKPYNCRSNGGHKGFYANNVERRWSSFVPSSLLTTSRTPAARTPMPKRHQQQLHTPKFYSPSPSMTIINDAPFCKFCLLNHLRTQDPAAPPQLRAMLFSEPEANLPSFSKRTQ